MEKILIIDDSMLERNILKDILKDRYEIISAESGAEGIHLARTQEPTLILLDIILGDIDGFETLKRFKEDEKTSTIPVIFLTGLQDEKTEEQGLLGGAVDYIRKPYNPNIVRARVETHVRIQTYRKTIESSMSLDYLTGVYNRNCCELQKEYYRNRAVQERKRLSVLLLDIDYFKQVNDTYGHQEGDYVLKQVAGEVQRTLPEGRFLARYGGEEFIAVLGDMERGEAISCAEKICRNIRELEIHNENSTVGPFLTVSIGGATILPQNLERMDMEQLFKEVDRSLYEAKRQGRNRVVWSKLE